MSLECALEIGDDNKLCNPVSCMDMILCLSQVDQNHSNIASISLINNSSQDMDCILGCQAGSRGNPSKVSRRKLYCDIGRDTDLLVRNEDTILTTIQIISCITLMSTSRCDRLIWECTISNIKWHSNIYLQSKDFFYTRDERCVYWLISDDLIQSISECSSDSMMFWSISFWLILWAMINFWFVVCMFTRR